MRLPRGRFELHDDLGFLRTNCVTLPLRYIGRMLRAFAALILACQALSYGTVVFCTGQGDNASHCASMSGMSAPASHATMHQPSDHSQHSGTCPLTHLCAVSATASLPAAPAPKQTTPVAVAHLNEFAPSGSILPAEPLAPPVPPPNS